MTFLNLLPVVTTILDEGCSGSCKGGCQSTCQGGCQGCRSSAKQTSPQEPVE